MSLITIQEKGCAKVNLALHVTGVQPDGYHTLDSIVTFTDVFDILFVKPYDKNTFTVTGEFAGSINLNENLVIESLELFKRKPRDRFSINLEKNLPIGAGLGGGSADAAAMIRALTSYYNYTMPSFKSIAKLGADIPVCIVNAASRVGGIGEVVEPINFSRIDLWIVLVNPGIFASTRSVFSHLMQKKNVPLEPFNNFDNTSDFIAYLLRQRNDLQDVARKKWPEINNVLRAIEETKDVLLSRMSGSGSTCFGLFDSSDMALKAMNDISKKNNNWWVRFSKIV